MIHGDIKPQNVLVFQNAAGTTVKLADFGYSTLTAGEMQTIRLPKSTPWNAPEHQHGKNSNISEAKKADVYSFGLLCLWANRSAGASLTSTTIGSDADLGSFCGSSALHTIEQLKNGGGLENAAQKLI